MINQSIPLEQQTEPKDSPAPAFSGSNTSFTPSVRKKSKGPVWLLFVLLGAFFIAMLYFIVSNLFLSNESQYGKITLSKEIDAHSGSAIIVRDENVYYEEDVANIDFVASEGYSITKSSLVCTVYTNGLSRKELSTLSQYREEIKKQQINLISGLASPDTRLDQINSKIERLSSETQSLVRGAQGDLIAQELALKSAISERQSYLKGKFPDDTKLLRLYDNESSQLQKIETWAKHLVADQNGIISFYTDGYENTITKDNYLTINSNDIKSMISGTLASSAKTRSKSVDIYRIVQPSQWYVVMHIVDRDWTPLVGDEYQLTIESFKNTTVSATITAVTKTGSDLYIRLAVNSSVEPILYIRNCQVHISKSKDSFAVPTKALVEENGAFYIVLAFREGNYLLPIEVLSRTANEVHFVPTQNISLAEGMSVLMINK